MSAMIVTTYETEFCVSTCRERFLKLVSSHKHRPAVMKKHTTETVHMDGQDTSVELFQFEL